MSVRSAILVASEGVEQSELTSPWQALSAAGGTPQLVAPVLGRVQAYHYLDKGDTFPVDVTVDQTSAAEFDLLVLPGGVPNSDDLRLHPDAVALVWDFFAAGKPVATICHGPWMLIEAGVARGRTVTSWPSLRTDLRNAGATWVDEQVRICTDGPNTLITSRMPADLDAFTDAVLNEMSART
jgi:protease I